MTFKLGLTGSIGMGKSTTAKMFEDHGFALWDADAAVHRLYAKGGRAVEVLAEVMPDVIVDGAVSRDKIKRRLELDPSALATLERYVHPLVAADRARFAKDTDHAVAVFDIPLLFETKADAWMDAVAVVSTSADEQRKRVMARGSMSAAEFEMILQKQMPDAEKRARADYVIDTTTLELAREGVEKVVEDIKARLTDA